MKTFVTLLLIALDGGGILSTASAIEDMAANSKPLTSFDEALHWLQVKAVRLIRASRTPMPNGVAAFPPQAGAGYEAFWLRDYAYQLEGCVDAFSDKELRDACRVFVNALRADGAGVDCVKFNGTPIYMPGYGGMGANPVADGSQFTVDVAWHTYQKTKDDQLLKEILDKLVKTMEAAPRNPATGLVHIKPGGWDRCPYGFTDSIHKQGDELFCSLLYIQACRQLGDLMEAGKRPDDAKKWRAEADRLGPMIRKTFWDEKTGLFLAATKLCNQPDIWGSAFAVYLDVATPEQAQTHRRVLQGPLRRDRAEGADSPSSRRHVLACRLQPEHVSERRLLGHADRLVRLHAGPGRPQAGRPDRDRPGQRFPPARRIANGCWARSWR